MTKPEETQTICSVYATLDKPTIICLVKLDNFAKQTRNCINVYTVHIVKQSVKNIRITWQLMTAKKQKAYIVHCIIWYCKRKKMSLTPDILCGKTLELSTENTNTTELRHCLWLYGCWHTTLSVWNRKKKKVQSQKCWSNKLDNGCVSCQQWNWLLILNTEKMLHALTWRAYQMSFKQLGWDTDMYGSHFYLIWVLFKKNIPDDKNKTTKKNTKES